MNKKLHAKKGEVMRNKFLKIRIFIICSSLVILVFSLPNLYSQETKVRIIKEGAILRLDSKEESFPIRNLPLGAMLEVEATEGEWLKVKLPPDERGFVVTGYIHQSFVTFDLGPVPAKPAEKIEEEKPKVAPSPQPKIGIAEKEEKRPAFGLGISAGYANPTEGIYDGGVLFSGRLCFSITKNIGLELKGLMFQSSVEGETEGLSTGKMTFVPIQLSLQGRFPLGRSIIPYVGLGAGYYLSSFKIDSEVVDDWDALGFDIEEEVENSLGFHFGLGADYFFTKNLALNADVSYCLMKLKGSWSLTDQMSGTQVTGNLEDLNFNTIMLLIGLKYYF
jgi:outer membrane protein W